MWVYCQSGGVLLDPSDKFADRGYSGRGQHKNCPASEVIPGCGPCPKGIYKMGRPFDSPEHGPLCIPLVPDATNRMYGRSGFLVRGDSVRNPGEASRGCLIFVRATREKLAASKDRLIEVVA
jgi:hypothetical protein